VKELDLDRGMSKRKRIKPLMTERARSLRRNAPVPERLLWGRLRGKRASDLRFRRQEVIGPYVADFLCAQFKLVIEFDGHSHDTSAERDARRDELLRERGYTVLRILNDEVIENLDGVVETISNAASQLSISTPTLPSPGKGEGLPEPWPL
jgi:very-short-patch-repair endonuclease